MLISGGELVLSDTTPTFARTDYYAPTGVALTDTSATYGQIYKGQLWVFVVVNKRAKATARLPIKVYSRKPTGRVDARDSDYAKLLRKPNPHHDPFFFWLWTSSTFDVYGEAIWFKIRDRAGIPVELWPVHPSLIRVHNVEGKLTYGYLGSLTSTGTVLLVDEADVVHFKTYNPDNTIRGMSPLEPLRQTLVNEDAARRATSGFWRNGARPGVALSHPSKLSDGAMKRLKAQWDSAHAGPDNYGSTVVLEEAMKPEIIPLNLEEAQYIESRKLNREEVCAGYDMPPPAVHILDRATFSNITEEMRSVYRDTMAPHLGGFESTMEVQLAPDFGDDSLYAEFLMEEVLRGAFEARAESYQKAINSGWMKPSEARELENLPPVADSDRLFINSSIIPIDATSSRTTPTAPASDAPLKSISRPALRTVMARIALRSSLAEIDTDALVAGLNGDGPLVLSTLTECRAVGDGVAEFCQRLWGLAEEVAA